MLMRGARKFGFLNRSGMDRESARKLVNDLVSAGAEFSVIRGDVSVLEDVEETITGLSSPVGGIFHAAMGLQVNIPAILRSQLLLPIC